jgi:acetyl-CoA acetyltransferase
MKSDIAISAVTELRPRRYPEMTELDLHFAAIEQLCRQWPIELSQIDGLIAAPTGVLTEGGTVVDVHEQLSKSLNIDARYAQTMYAGGATYCLMVARAADAIRSGLAEVVLCVSAGKFPKVGGASGERIARVASDPEFELPYGTFVPVFFGLMAQRWMAATGASQDDLAAMAVVQRRWAHLHPRAYMRKRDLTIDDVLSSRPIASPFHFLDCSIPLEGGAAILITSGERATQITRRPAWLLGYGEAHYGTPFPMRIDQTGGALSAHAAFEMAGLAPADISVAQLYDSFSANPLMYLEEFGFVKAGGAPALVRSGGTSPGGDLPVNTNGGLLSYGHSGDSSGMSMIVEAALQVMRRAGKRQVPRVRSAFVHAHGGMSSEHASLVLG